MLVTILKLEDQLILNDLVHLHMTLRPNCQRFTVKEWSVQKLTCGLRERREKTFIIWSQFLLWIHSYNIILTDIQESRRLIQLQASIQSIKKDSEPSTPTQFQLLLQPCSESMLSRMLSPPCSWPSKILSSTTKTSTLHGVLPMLDALEEISQLFLPLIYQDQLEVPSSKTKWQDKDLLFRPSGLHRIIRHGPTLPSAA